MSYLEKARKIANRDYGGDPRAVEMLLAHLNFEGGRVSGRTVQGIKFFTVGQNATHQFAMGMRDGQCYRLSVGEDSGPDIRELEDWEDCSYWGHR